MNEATAPPTAPQGDNGTADVKRLPALDGLRGLAILLVMQYHFWGLSFGLAGSTPTLAVDRFAHKLFGVGWCGVDLFFVLSGFLITGILYDAKGSASYFRIFYARRFLRIFPLYYAFLAFALLVLPNFNSLAGPAQVTMLHHTQFWYWTYMMNIAPALKQIHARLPLGYSQFWSLAVEEQFYLLWPLVLLLLSRRRMMILCAALVAGALALRIILVAPISASFASRAAPYNLLPARVDTLALGALLALALRGGTELARFRPHACVITACALVVLVILFTTEGGLPGLNPYVQTIGFSALALLFGALLLLVLTSAPDSTLYRVFTHPTLRFLGRYSYAIYVFHLVASFEVYAQFIRGDHVRTVFGSQIPVNIIFSLVCTTISVTAAWLSWHLFEKQILKLKRYLPYGHELAIIGPPSAAEQPSLAAP
jgi:peptidoglycan/LPS O-acetylase OafA/YrhL